MDDVTVNPQPASRRTGGRNARHKVRNAPLAKEIQPVHAGLTGGQYRPLTSDNIARIEQTDLSVAGRDRPVASPAKRHRLYDPCRGGTGR